MRKTLRLTIFTALLAMAGAMPSAANCPVDPAQGYITYESGSNKLYACAFGQIYQPAATTVSATNCTLAGETRYGTPTAARMGVCNGSKWETIDGGALTGTCTLGSTVVVNGEIAYGTTANACRKYLAANPACNSITLRNTVNDLNDVDYTDFGNYASISGNYALMGGRSGVVIDNMWEGGAAWIYKYSGGTWSLFKELVGSTQSTSDTFGGDLGLDGTTAAVGSIEDGGTNAGSVFIFNKDEGGTDNWGEVKRIPNPVNSTTAYFGLRLDLSGTRVIVGAYGSNNGPANSGRAAIFEKDQGGTNNWGTIKLLTGPAPVTNDNYGLDVTIEGNIAAVGAANEDANGLVNSGRVYIYYKDQGGTGNWGLLKSIDLGGSAVASDIFGFSIDLAGNTLAASAYGRDDNGSASGAVYIFRKDQGGTDNWGLFKTIYPDVPQASSQFSYDLSMKGNLLVVGAYTFDNGATDTGRAYVFSRNSGGTENWGQVATLNLATPEYRDLFGSSTSTDGTKVLVGARFDKGNGKFGTGTVFNSTYAIEGTLTAPTDFGKPVMRETPNVTMAGDYAAVGGGWTGVSDPANSRVYNGSGEVSVYKRTGNSWNFIKNIGAVSGSVSESDVFGTSIDMTPERILVSSPYDDASATSNSGRAYIFERDQGGADNWGRVAILTADTADRRTSELMGYFGAALNGNYALLGAAHRDGIDDDDEDTPVPTDFGTAYLFYKDKNGANLWGQVKRFDPDSEEENAYFGKAVDIAGDNAAVGAYGENSNGNDAGAVYIYNRNQGGADNWGRVKKITGDAAGTLLGYSLSISGDTLAVGAYAENTTAVDSGAVYVYGRNVGGTDNWGLVKKIKSGDPNTSDYFGYSVSLEGDLLVASALLDDGSGFTNSGAVYLFRKDQGGTDNWGQVAKYTPADAAASDYYGSAVSTDGRSVMITASRANTFGIDDGKVYLYTCNP